MGVFIRELKFVAVAFAECDNEHFDHSSQRRSGWKSHSFPICRRAEDLFANSNSSGGMRKRRISASNQQAQVSKPNNCNIVFILFNNNNICKYGIA